MTAIPTTPDSGNKPFWLTDCEKAAVARTERLRRIFAGKHRSVFLQDGESQHAFAAVGPNVSRWLYICDNICALATLKHCDFLFGEELSANPSDGSAAVADAIARISQASKLHPMLYDMGATAGWNGRAFLQAIIREGGVRMDSLDPANVFPQYEPGGTRMTAATVKQRVTIGGKNYSHVIEHTAGLQAQRLWELDAGDHLDHLADLSLIGLPAGTDFVQATGIDELTIVEIDNYTPEGSGGSDYTEDVLTLLDEMNNRLTQISRVLDKFGDPAMQVLSTLFNYDGSFRISGRAIPVETFKDGDQIRPVTWDAKLQFAAEQLDRALKAILRQLDVPPAILGVGADAHSDSWKKLKLTCGPLMARVNRKQIFMTPGIQNIFRVAMKLENSPNGPLGVSYPISEVSLTFSDGLPVDDTDLMTQVVGYAGAGLMSKKMALTWIHGDATVVEQELAQLKQEAEESLPTGLRGGVMDVQTVEAIQGQEAIGKGREGNGPEIPPNPAGGRNA